MAKGNNELYIVPEIVAVKAVTVSRNVSSSLGNVIPILVTKICHRVRETMFTAVYSEDVEVCMAIMFCIMGGCIKLSWWHDVQ